MNTNTQTVDERCAELASAAIPAVHKYREWMRLADEARYLDFDDDYELCEAAEYEHEVRNYANRIIAERTRELEAKS